MHLAAAAVVAILLLMEAVHCYPIRSRTGTENRSQERKVINGYIKGVYECLNRSTALGCCGLEECNIRATIGFEELDHNDANGTTITMTRLHFNTTFISQLVKQSTAVDLRAEMRVHKKMLSKDAILSLQSAGCNTSGIAIRLFEEHDIISELVLTERQLEVDEWVSFGNLSQMYNSWTSDTNCTMRSVRLDILASCRAIQPAFATALQGEERTPILVAYVSQLNRASFSSDVNSKIQRREVPLNASCDIYPHQIDLSDIYPNMIAPLQVSVRFCAGSCDQAQPNSLNINSWIQLSEHKMHPDDVPSLCCVPRGYSGYISYLKHEENVITIGTLLNYNAAACHCV